MQVLFKGSCAKIYRKCLCKNWTICFLLFKAFQRAKTSQNPMTGSRSKYRFSLVKVLWWSRFHIYLWVVWWDVPGKHCWWAVPGKLGIQIYYRTPGIQIYTQDSRYTHDSRYTQNSRYTQFSRYANLHRTQDIDI